MMSRLGPRDQEDSGHAGGDAEHETLEQRAAVLRLRRPCRPCPWRGGGKVLVNACGYLLVNLLKERGHHRVAVLGAKLMVRPGSGTNLIRGER